MIGFIDIHAHILPGIDDGARDWDESRRMLETAYEQRIRHIVATPHYSRRGLPPDIYDLAAKLQEEAFKIAPDFKIGLGQETYYHEGLVENLKAGTALSLAGTYYVLVEFEPQVTYHNLYQAVRKLTMARYIPVIAHMERYLCLREEKNLMNLLQCDCRLQMNYSSLGGNALWNKDVRWCRRQVLEGRIHCLSTDMHRMDYRKPVIEDSLKWIEKNLKWNEMLALIRGNAEEILR